MVLFIFLHAIRVWFTDRYRQYRWIQWVPAVSYYCLWFCSLVKLVIILVWDERSLLLTRMTVSARLMPCQSLANLTKPGSAMALQLANLTLSNFLFIHIGLSFALLFVLWLHYVRMTRPVLTPPPAVNFILVGTYFTSCLSITKLLQRQNG